MKEQTRKKAIEIIINIILTLGVLIIICWTAVLLINQMEERMRNDCEKQNNTGVIHYWDADVNCEAFIEGMNTQLIERKGSNLVKSLPPSYIDLSNLTPDQIARQYRLGFITKEQGVAAIAAQSQARYEAFIKSQEEER